MKLRTLALLLPLAAAGCNSDIYHGNDLPLLGGWRRTDVSTATLPAGLVAQSVEERWIFEATGVFTHTEVITTTTPGRRVANYTEMGTYSTRKSGKLRLVVNAIYRRDESTAPAPGEPQTTPQPAGAIDSEMDMTITGDQLLLLGGGGCGGPAALCAAAKTFARISQPL